MTIDEIIEECEQIKFGAEMMKQSEVYKYNKQLASWLKELQSYRKADEEIRSLTQVWEEGAGIKKCIDIIDKHLKEDDEDDNS